MKKNLKYVLLLAAMTLGFAACEKNEPKEDPAVFTISADQAFSNGAAAVSVNADKEISEDATIVLALDPTSTLTAKEVRFDQSIVMKKGTKQASVTATLDDSALAPGNYEAVFTAKVNGEAVNGSAKISATVLAPGITIAADKVLTEGKATIKVTASKTVVVPIEVALVLAETNTLPKDCVTLPEKITVAAGQTEATAEVVVDLEKLPYGEHVLAISATAGEASQTFTYNVNKELPAITIADILKLTPAEDQTAANFIGAIKDLVVCYKAPNGDVYAKDATGYIYIFGDKTLKVGDVVNGQISGKILTYYGVHEAKEVDITNATVTAGAAPDPEAITIAEINKNFDAKENAFVKLTGVINESDIVKSDKGTNNNISQGDDKLVLYIQKNTAIETVEAGSSFDVTGIVTLYKAKDGTITKEVKIWEPSAISNVKAPVKVPALERVFGLYTTSADSYWFKPITVDGVGLAAGLDRSVTMDDSYVYIVKASGYPEVFAASIANPANIKRLPHSVMDEGTRKANCGRMIKNTDASVNGGKDILLVCNLVDDNVLCVYAYKNGIDAEPTKELRWQWDTHANASDWRLYGDKFTVTGTWQDGGLWFHSRNANKAIYFPVKNGVIGKTEEVSYVIDGTSAVKDITFYPGSDAMFVTSASKAAFWTNTGNKNGNNWIEWAEGSSVDSAKGTYGYNFFTFNGIKYIACTKVEDTTHARVRVFEDKGTFDASLSSLSGLIELPIQDASDFTKACPVAASEVNGECTVRQIGDDIYILSMAEDMGISLFKMALKNQ